MKQKNIVPISILFAVMAGFVIMSIGFGSKMNTDTATLSERIYNKIMDYDLENDYPKTPQEIIDIYCDTLYYLYSGKANSTKIMDIILVQRKFYDDQLLNINQDANFQYTKTKLTIDSNKQNNFNIISVTHENPVYYDETDLTRCSIRVTQFSNAKADVELNLVTDYYLIRNGNNKWKIIGWENVDES